MKVMSVDSVSSEDLIERVADGEIDYTVATDEMGRITKTYHPNLDIGLQISFDQRASWAVRNTSPLLAEAADKWHKENINSDEFKVSETEWEEKS